MTGVRASPRAPHPNPIYDNSAATLHKKKGAGADDESTCDTSPAHILEVQGSKRAKTNKKRENSEVKKGEEKIVSQEKPAKKKKKYQLEESDEDEYSTQTKGSESDEGDYDVSEKQVHQKNTKGKRSEKNTDEEQPKKKETKETKEKKDKKKKSKKSHSHKKARQSKDSDNDEPPTKTKATTAPVVVPMNNTPRSFSATFSQAQFPTVTATTTTTTTSTRDQPPSPEYPYAAAHTEARTNKPKPNPVPQANPAPAGPAPTLEERYPFAKKPATPTNAQGTHLSNTLQATKQSSTGAGATLNNLNTVQMYFIESQMDKFNLWYTFKHHENMILLTRLCQDKIMGDKANIHYVCNLVESRFNNMRHDKMEELELEADTLEAQYAKDGVVFDEKAWARTKGCPEDGQLSWNSYQSLNSRMRKSCRAKEGGELPARGRRRRSQSTNTTNTNNNNNNNNNDNNNNNNNNRS